MTTDSSGHLTTCPAAFLERGLPVSTFHFTFRPPQLKLKKIVKRLNVPLGINRGRKSWFFVGLAVLTGQSVQKDILCDPLTWLFAEISSLNPPGRAPLRVVFKPVRIRSDQSESSEEKLLVAMGEGGM